MSEAYKIYNQKEECFISSEVLEGDTHASHFLHYLDGSSQGKKDVWRKEGGSILWIV